MSATLRNVKWELTFNVTGGDLIQTNVGLIRLMKVVMVDRGSKVKIEVSGNLAGAPGFSRTFRTAVYNVNGYKGKPPAPQWLLDMVGQASVYAKEMVPDACEHVLTLEGKCDICGEKVIA